MDDPLLITNSKQEYTTALRGFLNGSPTFLVCGGPSAKSCNLSWLNHRGIWSMAVNNMAGWFKPNAFICSDPPSKFHHGIWLDPSIMKFLPIPKLKPRRGSLREKHADGTFTLLVRDGQPRGTYQCPNAWGYHRQTQWNYDDDTFFTADYASLGNGGKSNNDHDKVLCTMLAAIRVLYHLGSKKIYLVGVDFNMRPEAGYAFGQTRTQENATGNNNQYRVVNEGLCEMVRHGIFQKFGLEIYNCYERSGLRAFPYVPFETAYLEALQGFPSEPFSLDKWYEK